jgi:surface protein
MEMSKPFKITNSTIMTLVKQYIKTPYALPVELKKKDAEGNMVPIPIGQWDVSEVTNMDSLFMGHTNFNEPLNTWNVSNVTIMSNMFNSCRHFNQPLDQWNVGRVTKMNSMFSNCWDFNQPLNIWANDTRRVENMKSMFYDCKSFNKPLDRWNVSGVRSMNDMFYMATRFRQNLTGWDVTNVRLLGLGLTWDVYARQMFDRSGMMEYRELWPRFGTPPQPQTVAPRVDQYQVHRESGKIDYAKLNAFYVEALGGEPSLPSSYPGYIQAAMTEFIERVGADEAPTTVFAITDPRAQRRAGLEQIMTTRLNGLNYQEKSQVVLQALVNTVEYVKRQPPAFQRAYVDAFVRDCTTAYEGQGDAAMTCATGALERVILSVTNAIQTMNSVDQGRPEWDTLLDIITVSPRTKIPELIRAWYKAHKTGEDGRPTAFTVDERNAEGRRAHLKAELLRAYPREEELIETKISEIADNIGYKNDDFDVQYGGRRRRRTTRRTRYRTVSKPRSKGKRYRKNKTRKV